MSLISTPLRKSAKGQPCTMRIPGICNHNYETTVLCHCPSKQKGMGNKSSDYWAAFGCSNCHTALDTHAVENEEQIWLQAINETWKIWVELGLIEIKGANVPDKLPMPSPRPLYEVPNA